MGCKTHTPTIPTTSIDRLQGTWVGDKATVTIDGKSFRFYRDEDFWFETTITLRENTEPQELHATILQGPPSQHSAVGEVVPAIFKIEEDILTLVAFSGNDDEPRPLFEEASDMRYVLRKTQQQE